MTIENQPVQLPLLSQKNIILHIKREDFIHPFVSGNKFRKLKYNLIEARKQGFESLLTFGGAYSNHIAATAYAAREKGFKSIGVIRGEELADQWSQNPTLRFAKAQGMQLHFVSRETYRTKTDARFLDGLQTQYGPAFILPEGGANALAVKGCEEILKDVDARFHVLCSCVGTGGTLAGIINSSAPTQSVLGFPALKGDFLKEDIRKFAQKGNWELQTDYHFGGYAKVDERLIRFINDFRRKTGIPLDPIYTGKMVFGILDLIKKDFFPPNTSILAIHTGGLQGIAGMNQRLKRKHLPLLEL
ncbi:1-aminocyclopropane-1-carboxylate deaminase/D-cysteine desulfhydrase [Flavobacteriaceae bacterium TP-CH-4]|uniref:1-aminocyclopropane-1-carboxylate deaminase/D-cysteine desulfhydrase n=1 Tax=Pelagihabitans pacificus TaxID=2696054 RepID=A0A967ECQ2_9FLAO|nr:1-aminocyclopropane-1-carboxylate deaminase/D-cysteine desulfhydrase [Pelagihabitans pacificus]NHF61426.1 1-aminocyclopropane-1-carboxylate deaminase/D-cysteine desulfhydrase [Pelagihabitans pacificus]